MSGLKGGWDVEYKSLILGVCVAWAVGALLELRDASAALAIVNAAAPHLRRDVQERLYQRILERADCGGEQ